MRKFFRNFLLSRYKEPAASVLGILLLLIFWKLISLYVRSSVILPSPLETWHALISILKDVITYKHIGATVIRGCYGFIIAVISGLLVGISGGLLPLFRKVLNPLIHIIRSTPVMSVILLALIWFSSDAVPVFVSFLMIFPVICANVISGIVNVDTDLIEMAKVYRVEKKTILKWIYLPSIGNFLYPGLETAAGLTWKVVIAAEVLSRPAYAMGSAMQESRIYIETASVFAWTAAALLVSAFFSFLIKYFYLRIFPGIRSKNRGLA